MIEKTSVIEECSLFYFFVIIRNLTKYFSQSLWPVKLFKLSRFQSSSVRKPIFLAQSNDQKSLYAPLFIIHLIYFDIMLILNQSSKPVKVTFSYTGKANFAHRKHLRRYNMILAGIDRARDRFCPPTSAQVPPQPRLCLLLSTTQTGGELWQKVSKKGHREEENGDKRITRERSGIERFPFEEKQSKTGLFGLEKSPEVTFQWPNKTSTVWRRWEGSKYLLMTQGLGGTC